MNAAGGTVQVPGLAGADVAIEFQGTILGQNTHGIDAGVGAVGEGEVDDAVFSAEGYRGFCHLTGQDIQAAALSAGQKHGDALFFHVGLLCLILKCLEILFFLWERVGRRT